MSKPNEDAIRDHLAQHLEIIESGLTLVDREHYLKNTNGASGFLDIFARASNGQLVIIEIKRTDAAARETLQELFKYAALLRQRYLIRNIDYRLIVLSVKWHELLTPYSEFVKQAPYEVSAGQIVLGSDGLPIRVDAVAPVQIPGQRKISKRHFLWRFADKAAAVAAIPLIAGHMQKAGLDDFVLVCTKPSDPAYEGIHFIYFAQQELSLIEYQKRIRTQLSHEEYKEYEGWIADLTEEEDRVGESADQVWLPGYDDLYDQINPYTSEISHPEKAAYWFEDGAQSSIEIKRYGRFNNDGISDEEIIEELIGHSGASDYHLKISAQTDSAPQITTMLEAVENIFFFNNDWRGAVKDLISYAQRTGPATIKLTAYSNEDVLRAIAGAAFNYPGFIPIFRMDIERIGKTSERFIGLPEWDGTIPDFDTVLESYFNEDHFSYFLAHHFGEHRSINIDIMRDLGLRYAVFLDNNNNPERIRVQGSSIVKSPQPIKGSIFSLIEKNADEVCKIVDLFMRHDLGFAQIITEWVNNNPVGEQPI